MNLYATLILLRDAIICIRFQGEKVMTSHRLNESLNFDDKSNSCLLQATFNGQNPAKAVVNSNSAGQGCNKNPALRGENPSFMVLKNQNWIFLDAWIFTNNIFVENVRYLCGTSTRRVPPEFSKNAAPPSAVHTLPWPKNWGGHSTRAGDPQYCQEAVHLREGFLETFGS